MPQIHINFGYILDLGNLPFWQMLWRLFLDGGWIVMVIIAIRGFWELWIISRQIKYSKGYHHTILAIDVPRQNEQTAKAAEQIFAVLAGSFSNLTLLEKWWEGKYQPTFSFEIASVAGYVQFLVHTPVKYRNLVEAAIYAQYPDAEITEVIDYTDRIPGIYPHPEWDLFGSELVLRKPSHYPIRTHIQFEHSVAEDNFKDPMASLLEMLASLKKGEIFWVQFLLTPTNEKWKDEGEKAVEELAGRKPKSPPKGISVDPGGMIGMTLNELTGVTVGGAGVEPEKQQLDMKMLNMTPGERQVLEQVQMKLSKVAFNTKIRYVYAGRHDVFAKSRISQMKGVFSQYASLDMNSFKNYGKVTPKQDYPWQRWEKPGKQKKIMRHFRERSNEGAPHYHLNVEELATIFHFPMMTLKVPLIKKTDAKRSEPPAVLPTAHDPALTLETSYTPVTPPPPEPVDEEPDDSPPKNLPFA